MVVNQRLVARYPEALAIHQSRSGLGPDHKLGMTDYVSILECHTGLNLLNSFSMSARYIIYERYVDGCLNYTFSCGDYRGEVGQAYYLYQGGLLLNFNIAPEFHGLGIGNAAFNNAYESLNEDDSIKFIAGNWMKGKEFKHLEGGCCTNFRIFKRGQNAGLSDHEAALQTPTGKWSNALGFNKVAVISSKARSVEVRFYRNVTDADPKLSFGIESYLLS